MSKTEIKVRSARLGESNSFNPFGDYSALLAIYSRTDDPTSTGLKDLEPVYLAVGRAGIRVLSKEQAHEALVQQAFSTDKATLITINENV